MRSRPTRTYAKNLKGHLLLAHGTMDDNVPPSNTLLVVDALIKANKDFDLIMIPNAHHGYGAASYYMMRRRWDYFVKNLLGGRAAKEYELKPTTTRGSRLGKSWSFSQRSVLWVRRFLVKELRDSLTIIVFSSFVSSSLVKQTADGNAVWRERGGVVSQIAV